MKNLLFFLLFIYCGPIYSRARPTKSDHLLSSLFRQTIYQRIENLLLDPGRKSSEKQKIIDSAVDNYHKQKMVLPITEEYPAMTEMTGNPKRSGVKTTLKS